MTDPESIAPEKTDELQVSFQDFVARSLARPGVSKYFTATGIRIHYLEWEGPPGAPAVLLLHGFLGNAHWWDFIAPWLAENYRIIAPDFGGMGDSGYRDKYVHDTFIGEIGAVIEHAKLAPCTVIGHSFGGRATLFACERYPQLIRHGIVVDSRLASREDPMRREVEAWRPKKRYARIEDILPRFRLRPEEPVPAATLAHLARCSVKQDGDAWVWKFDEQITHLFRTRAVELAQETDGLGALPMPIDILSGELSKVCTPQRVQRMVDNIHNARGPIIIPTAYHHIPIGQPLALLAALRSLLAVAAARSTGTTARKRAEHA